MKYLFLLNGPDEPLPEPGTPAHSEMFQRWNAATRAMAEAGVLIDCAPLQPAEAATTVRVRDGETLLTDGPAAEIKEQFGGFTLVECADLDEALRWATTVPTAERSHIGRRMRLIDTAAGPAGQRPPPGMTPQPG
jgi:hypothetical protein